MKYILGRVSVTPDKWSQQVDFYSLRNDITLIRVDGQDSIVRYEYRSVEMTEYLAAIGVNHFTVNNGGLATIDHQHTHQMIRTWIYDPEEVVIIKLLLEEQTFSNTIVITTGNGELQITH